jgi:hypothetical protein
MPGSRSFQVLGPCGATNGRSGEHPHRRFSLDFRASEFDKRRGADRRFGPTGKSGRFRMTHHHGNDLVG